MLLSHHLNLLLTHKGIFYPFFVAYYISVEIRYRNNCDQVGYDGVTTTREVFYGVISQGVALFIIIMEKKKICSFFGHSDLVGAPDLHSFARQKIIDAIEFGCRIFYFGGFGEFDALCYKIVTELKNSNPELALKRVYCVTQEQYLRNNTPLLKKEDYDEITCLTPTFDGWETSIYFRNCAIIDESDVVIFYAEERENSGAYKTYQYAQKKKDKKIINLLQ